MYTIIGLISLTILISSHILYVKKFHKKPWKWNWKEFKYFIQGSHSWMTQSGGFNLPLTIVGCSALVLSIILPIVLLDYNQAANHFSIAIANLISLIVSLVFLFTTPIRVQI